MTIQLSLFDDRAFQSSVPSCSTCFIFLLRSRFFLRFPVRFMPALYEATHFDFSRYKILSWFRFNSLVCHPFIIGFGCISKNFFCSSYFSQTIKSRVFLFDKLLKRTIYVHVTTFSYFFRSFLYKIYNSNDKKTCIPFASVYSSDYSSYPKFALSLPIWRFLLIPQSVSSIQCVLYLGREHRKVG